MFEELKPLMENGERYVVVEHGKPEYVVLRFRDYVSLTSGGHRHGQNAAGAPYAGLAGANADLASVRARSPEVEFPEEFPRPTPANEDPSTVRLEDLPL